MRGFLIIPFIFLSFYNSEVSGGLALNGTDCTTRQKNRGVCLTIENCYPILFKPENSPRTETDELANIIAENVGFCRSNNDVKINEIADLYDKTGIAIDIFNSLICCPNEEEEPVTSDEIEATGDSLTKTEKVRVNDKECGQRNFQEDEASATETVTVATEEEEEEEDCFAVTQSKVVGGRPAKERQFPWSVAMIKNNRQFCGGSLISRDSVLTAAHCIKGLQNLNGFELMLGGVRIKDRDSTRDVVIANISKAYYHRFFSFRTLDYDIGLLRLSEPVNYTDSIRPICLSSNEPVPEEDGQVSGWGKQGFQESGTSNNLRYTNVMLWSTQKCKDKYKKLAASEKQRFPRISTNMVCAAGKTNQDSCHGDSGGPLQREKDGKFEQIGIVSWGWKCKGPEGPGVYTKVNKFMSWIEERETTKIKDI